MLIIISCWIIGAAIGFLPLFGWNNKILGSDGKCFFVEVIGYDFLVFLFFATIVLPALVMAFFYARIYLVVIRQVSFKPSNFFYKMMIRPNIICLKLNK